MYFAEPVLFEIPVRPRIRKFIRVQLQDANGRSRPMLVDHDSTGASLMLWALAQSQKIQMSVGWRRAKPLTSYLSVDGAGRIIAPDDMTDAIGLAIHEFHQSRHQYLLNYAELETFSSWVDYIIRNEMIFHCEQLPQLSYIDRIKSFTDKYDFSEEDFSESTALKAYYRYRNGQLGEYHSFKESVARVVQFKPLIGEAIAA